MRLRLSLFDRVLTSQPFFCLISPLQHLRSYLSSSQVFVSVFLRARKITLDDRVTVELGFAWCRSGTNWLTQPRDLSSLACEQELDPALHQLNRSSESTGLLKRTNGVEVKKQNQFDEYR